ncbi:hypothetical protein JYA63_03470 [Fictibacillus nanhaiensis]|uniref:Uncharacterized protein n=1 Tax=Fictibacillus nanhaiensis TaxID=742169 RepID=A0ABS2ZPI7_9BACL|nr:hypothetical protein [Fictibacillus nanhaiensis]
MKNTQTIQISIYNSFNNSFSEKTEYEFVYEAKVTCVAEFIVLTYQFNKFVKYKKPTDKNWYTPRTMIKRLFKNEIENIPLIKIAEVNCWEKKREEANLKREQADLRREERQGITDKAMAEMFEHDNLCSEFDYYTHEEYSCNNTNLNTKDEIVVALKKELSNKLGDIRNDRIICSDFEYPVRYEVQRAIADYVSSLIYRLTDDEEYHWKKNNSPEIHNLDKEINEYRLIKWSELEQQ